MKTFLHKKTFFIYNKVNTSLVNKSLINFAKIYDCLNKAYNFDMSKKQSLDAESIALKYQGNNKIFFSSINKYNRLLKSSYFTFIYKNKRLSKQDIQIKTGIINIFKKMFFGGAQQQGQKKDYYSNLSF